MQPNQENNVPNRPVVTRRPINANARPVRSAAARVPVDAGPTFNNGPSIVGSKGGRKTGWVLAIILLLLIAAGSVGFGVWAYMDGNNTKNSLNAQINTLQKQNSELQTQIDNLAGTISVDTDGNEVNTADYIYVGEWGIKIKVPESLSQVSYLFDSRADESNAEYLYVNGVSGEYGTVPSFVNTSTQEFWLGVLNRYPSGSAEEMPTGMRGTFVTTISGYDYYYGHPQNATTDSDEQDLELKTVGEIQDMLTNVDNYSAI